jgi:hypothetical protein
LVFGSVFGIFEGRFWSGFLRFYCGGSTNSKLQNCLRKLVRVGSCDSHQTVYYSDTGNFQVRMSIYGDKWWGVLCLELIDTQEYYRSIMLNVNVKRYYFENEK